MARILPLWASQLIIFFFISSIYITSVTGEHEGFVKSLDRKHLGLKSEKFSHFRFYFQNIISGQNPPAVVVVPPPFNTSWGFGQIHMMDDPLTLETKLSSKLVGRAQGLYASASEQQFGLPVVMNLVFIEGKYNGSTITVLGRNTVFSTVREMPVIGGSRIFRWAMGDMSKLGLIQDRRCHR